MRHTKLCIGLTLMSLLMLGGDAFSVPSDLDKCEPHTYYFSDGSQCVQVTVQNTSQQSSRQNHSVTWADDSTDNITINGGAGTTFLCHIKRLVAHETNNLTSTMEHTVSPPP